MPQKIHFEWELPDESFGEGFDKEMFVAKVKEDVAMRLLKERRISQGKAAELLGISPRKADSVWAYARVWLYNRIIGDKPLE